MLWEQRIIKRFDENKKYPICKKRGFYVWKGIEHIKED